MEVTAAIVNYGTPALTRQAVWSLRSLYPELPIRVLDNASPDGSVAVLRALAPEVQPFVLAEANCNLHHGPGLDRLIREVETPWVLAFDSDCLAYRRGFVEGMLEQAQSESAYLVGPVIHVDDNGFNTDAETPGAHRYVHPHCLLVRREAYLGLPPFEQHGAPCLANQIEAAAQGLPLVDFPVSDYVFHLGRGTVERHGYGLGARSVWQRLQRMARGWLPA